MDTKKSTVNSGWVEVLYRKNPSKEFTTLSDIIPDDYELAGPSPVPIRELNRPYDVYVMLHENRLLGMPREVVHGDILNVCVTSPVKAVRTYVLLNPKKVKATLTGGTYRIDIEEPYPIGMLKLPQKFSSFWEDKHQT